MQRHSNTTPHSLKLILEVRKCYFPTHFLADNEIGDSGASSIAEVLKHNSSLTQIDFSCKRSALSPTHFLAGNEIGASGASSIAEALEYNSFTQLGYGAIQVTQLLAAFVTWMRLLSKKLVMTTRMVK